MSILKQGILVVQGHGHEKGHLLDFARENIREKDILNNLAQKFTYEYTWDVSNTYIIKETLRKKEYDLVLLAPSSTAHRSEISALVPEDTELRALEHNSYREVAARKQEIFFS